jgi:hypothetical protein
MVIPWQEGKDLNDVAYGKVCGINYVLLVVVVIVIYP